LIKKAKVKGNFSDENFKINLIGTNTIKSFKNSNREIVKDKSVGLDVVFVAEPNSGVYNLSKGNITYQGIQMGLVGSLSIYNNSLKIDASIIANNMDIKSAIKNLPEENRTAIGKYKLAGNLDLKANINGYIGGSKSPHIQFTSNVRDASFYLSENNISFSNLQLQIDYDNGNRNDLRSSKINIRNLKTKSDFGSIEGKMQIVDLWQPKVKMDISSSLELSKLHDLLSVDTIESMNGQAKLHSWVDMSLIYVDSSASWNISNTNIDNNFDIKNASFAFVNSALRYDSVSATGRMENNNIQIKNFVLYSQGSKLNGNIAIRNLPIDIFQKSPKQLSIIGDIVASKITYDQISSAFPSSTSNDSRFSDEIYLDLNLHIGSFKYKDIIASNIAGRLKMNNRKLYSNEVSLEAFNGKIHSSFVMDGTQQGVYHFMSEGDISKANITKVFTQLDNFDQETITDKNLKGTLSSTYNFKTDFDDNWNILKPSIEMSADIEINNGELVGMTSLNALKDYTKIDDFSNIHFSTLKNNIYIKDEKITIPDMVINSDKMNINLYGVHDFDNKYEYHFVVLLSEVLGKHYQEKLITEFGEVENDGYGKTRLFFTMKGQGDKFDVSYDRSGLGKKLKGDLKEEKASLKNALKEEFGLFKTDEEKAKAKSDSLKTNAKQKEKEQLKKQEEGKFILEWDEDDG
jgi:hypothetical protein